MSNALTLYLDLTPGTKPNLAVVAKAALEFDTLVKELAFQFDPTVSVQLDLESGTHGSLKLNSWLKSAKDKALDPKVQWAIILGVLFHFGDQAAGYLTNKLFEEAETHLIGEDEQLSQKDIQAIAEEVVQRLEKGAGKKEASRVFAQLQADDNITGVGVSPRSDERPRIVVPRSEFPIRSASAVEVEVEGATHERTEVVEVVLISPVLLPGDRRWKFKGEGPEFGASVKDHEFLVDVIAGRHHIEMRGGIKMTIWLETSEEFDGQVWVAKNRSVLKVLNTEAGPMQIEFPSSLPEPNGNDNQQ